MKCVGLITAIFLLTLLTGWNVVALTGQEYSLCEMAMTPKSFPEPTARPVEPFLEPYRRLTEQARRERELWQYDAAELNLQQVLESDPIEAPAFRGVQFYLELVTIERISAARCGVMK